MFSSRRRRPHPSNKRDKEVVAVPTSFCPLEILDVRVSIRGREGFVSAIDKMIPRVAPSR